MDFPQAAQWHGIVGLFQKLDSAGCVTVAAYVPLALQCLQDRSYAVGGTYPEPLADLPYRWRPFVVQDHLLNKIENLTLSGCQVFCHSFLLLFLFK
jgi:hypothetical protein